MYIRRKVFSVAYDEMTGEEKLFSTTEIQDEDQYLERLYADTEAENEGKHDLAKKAAIGAGAAASLAAAGYGGYKLGTKNLKKKQKELLERIGQEDMANAIFGADKKEAAKAAARLQYLKDMGGKVAKKWNEGGKGTKAAMVGLPLAAAGAIGYGGYKLHKHRKAEKEYADTDDYEGLNYTDLMKNTRDKNPFTIKKLRELRREHKSKENGKARELSALRAGAAGLGAGLATSYLANPAAGLLAGVGTGAATYGLDRAGRRLRNKIRKSGGGGTIDDSYAREYDRLAMLDGKMSKKEFKDKWYRGNQAK